MGGVRPGYVLTFFVMINTLILGTRCSNKYRNGKSIMFVILNITIKIGKYRGLSLGKVSTNP